jgi:hypothetical protein
LQWILRPTDGIRVTQERELHTVRELLALLPCPNAIQTVIEAAGDIGPPIDSIAVAGVERWSSTPHHRQYIHISLKAARASSNPPSDRLLEAHGARLVGRGRHL